MQRFWDKVEIRGLDDCWNWKAARLPKGYGKFSMGHAKWVYAHRVAYALQHGSFPGDLKVLHRCDNPQCVNPAHLFLGTQQDNVTDMVMKGRMGTYDRSGERNPRNKLTISQVQKIRSLRSLIPQSELAQRFGVTRSTIAGIQHKRIWRSLCPQQ